eukprot:861081-Pelagomonas_calceolata.AAC.2
MMLYTASFVVEGTHGSSEPMQCVQQTIQCHESKIPISRHDKSRIMMPGCMADTGLTGFALAWLLQASLLLLLFLASACCRFLLSIMLSLQAPLTVINGFGQQHRKRQNIEKGARLKSS